MVHVGIRDVHAQPFSQNAELLSSLDSASVRIVKPPSFPAPPLRLHPSAPQQTNTPPVFRPGPDSGHTSPPLDSPRMATIHEDPSLDSRLDEDELEEDFGRAVGAGSVLRSFEDLTKTKVTCRSEKAKLYQLQRHRHVESKETQC